MRNILLTLALLVLFSSCNQSENKEKSKELLGTGIAKEEAKDHFGAIADYTKAIELNPNYAAAYNNRGNSKNKIKDYKGAKADYTKAIELKPNYTKGYGNTSWNEILYKMG